jgi:predicted enzyme related to lactoylglutathione lyase
MPTRESYAEGTPSWTDLSTPDVEGAKAFYHDLFGWEYTEEETDSTPYVLATQKGLDAAGIGELPDKNMPSVWSTYFAVEDADATATKIKEAGGSLRMECLDVMDAGRMAFAADPNGAVFAIWEAKNHSGAAIVNEHGAMNWNELLSDNLEAGLDFYSTVFGSTHETTQTPDGGYTSFAVGGRVVAGAMPKADPEIPNNWGVYFAVDDTARAIETAGANGGHVTYGPMEIHDVGIFAGIADPFGANFTVIQLAQPVD